MSQYNRVIWSEGLFLRPQHFQQQDRHFDAALRTRIDGLAPYAYGFQTLALDIELLKQGKLGIALACGVMPDGTYVEVPGEVGIPAPLTIPDECKETIVYLTLPLRRPGMAEMAFAASRESELVRYLSAEQEARDYVLENDSSATLNVGQLNLRLQLADTLAETHCALGIARVREKRADGQVVLDDSYIPAALDCRANPRLREWVREIYGLLRHRAQALADRVSQPGAKGVADFADFLLLELCNRYQPLFGHLFERSILHPEAFYRTALMLAGELATFGRRERRCPDFVPYRHDALEVSFPPVIEEIRRALTAVLEQTAVAIALVDKGRGVYFGEVSDVGLLRGASFILAVQADQPAEQLRVAFPTQVKIGPVEKIRDMVISHLPGIGVRPLPVAPRQIPYHAGYNYFELDRKSEFWKGIEVSRVIAMHVAGDFPGLTLEMWAVRD